MKTLKDHSLGFRGPVKPLPDSAGYWIRCEDGFESVCLIDLDDAGKLAHWCNGRPVMDYDRGEWWGPFSLLMNPKGGE